MIGNEFLDKRKRGIEDEDDGLLLSSKKIKFDLEDVSSLNNIKDESILSFAIMSRDKKIIKSLIFKENLDWNHVLKEVTQKNLIDALNLNCKEFNSRLFDRSDCALMMQSNLSCEKILDVVDKPSFVMGELQEVHLRLIVASICYLKNLPSPKFLFEDDFLIYCHYLKASCVSTTEQFFIFSKGHWKTGVAKVSKTGRLEMFINDSREELCAPERDIFTAVFRSEDAVLYTPNVSIQSSGSGCSVFAIDAWYRQQKIIPCYLPSKYKGDLFRYFNEEPIQTVPEMHHKVVLPLYLMKSMQSRDLHTRIIPSRVNEVDLVINQKGQTPLESARRYFLNNRNHRINARLVKMRKKVEVYLKECGSNVAIDSIAKMFPRARY